ncbi:MAG: N-succinylarginine dihydrolase [Pirellula sp.]
MIREYVEVNIDGMIGPSHHFGGLGVENKASELNSSKTSSPRNAAMQGLEKMELLASYGIPQFYLPPPARPAWKWLESLGFNGERGGILRDCYQEQPKLLSAAYSSAFMWTANAASVSCGSDTRSGRSKIKLANLNANLHRSIEESERLPQLAKMFEAVERVDVLRGLCSSRPLSDEGAANQMRFCTWKGILGVYAFVYGGEISGSEVAETNRKKTARTKRRQPRQTRVASAMVARSLDLEPDDCFFFQQTSDAIDAGVFHNDVIATSHENLLLYHELAFHDSEEAVARIRKRFLEKTGQTLEVSVVVSSDLRLDHAVDTYLFNSQICTDSEGGWRMFLPDNCKQSESVQRTLDRLRSQHPRLRSIDYCPLAESMRNGGGPACLRLRISLTPNQIDKISGSMRISSSTLSQLRKLVETEYPEKVEPSDFANPDFAEHCERISMQIAQLWDANSGVSR